MKTLFKLDAVSVTENGKKAVFNTIQPNEKDDCEGADKGDFPKGLFGKFPIYLTSKYTGLDGKEVNIKGKCFATPTPTEFVVYEADAYRKCAWKNKE